VYPGEVEAVLNAHPAVVRSAVVGKTIEGDEQIFAFVQPSPGAGLTAKDLAQYAAGQLASYKRPTRILLVPTLPMTPTGKIIKGELTKMAAQTGQVRDVT
ncbi:MAG: hypothetical protein JOZ36_18485, partial [Acidobacteria bacterium]|nr:hypothetical protein [Acidobacteriota bacterium]